MAVTLDIGNYKNINPANKQDVGYRLAGLALKNDYMRDISVSGPSYESHRIEGRKLILSFFSNVSASDSANQSSCCYH